MTGKEGTGMDLKLLRPGEGKAYWIVGDLNTILASGEDTGGAFAMIHVEVQPGGGPPPHVHSREDEAFYVLDGSVTFQADGKAIPASAGAWITLPRGSLHTFRNTGTTVARMLILVTPSGLERFFAEVGREVTDRTAAPPPVTAADIQKLLAVAPRYGIDIRPPA
jgi:quercetin dioxygenase-like cupin family protein